MSAAEKVQPTEPVVVPAGSVTAPNESIASSVADAGKPPVTPVVVTVPTLGRWVSPLSASLNWSRPATEITVFEPCTPASSVNAPLAEVPSAITGASLLPVTVMTTFWATLPPLPSAIWTT